MQAVVTTYEMIVLDTPHLLEVDWKCLIIDEAHRLKNLSCKLVECLRSMKLVTFLQLVLSYVILIIRIVKTVVDTVFKVFLKYIVLMIFTEDLKKTEEQKYSISYKF